MKIENNEMLKQIAYQMIRSGAPERQVELDGIWEKHSPKFIYLDDRPGFTLDSGPFGILRLTDRTLRLIWLFGHIAWRAFCLYGPLIHLCVSGKYELDFVEAESDDEETAVYDLVGKAMVFIFLHELKHIQFRNSNEEIDMIKEEEACDDYARAFLVDNIENYSLMSGDDYLKVLGKRAMGIALASFLVLELTPKERWRGSTTHPSVYGRLNHIMNYPELDEEADYWLYLGSLLITKLRLMRFRHSLI